MIAPSTTALSALGPAAAAANAGWWIDAPSASMPTIGWMPGITCVTLPMSVLPSGSARLDVLGAPGRGPAAPSRRGRPSASHGSGASSAYGGRGLGRPRASQPVATAPARKQSAILSSRSRSDSGVGGAHRVAQLGAAGNDVGGLPAVGDDAVHHLPRRQLLAQQPDRHLRDGDRVGGVDTQIRRDGGVRFAAGVADRRPPTAPATGRAAMSSGPGCSITVAAMSSNVPALSSNAFPPPASSAGVPSSTTVRPSSSATSASASAVPTAEAAMMLWPQACPISGQRVVLGADADDQRAAAEVGAKRGVQAAGCRGDLEAALGDQRLRLGAAAVFGEREFRLGVDGVRQLDQIATASLDGVFDAQRRRWRWASSQYLTDGRSAVRQLSSRTVTDPDALAAAVGARHRASAPASTSTTSPWSSGSGWAPAAAELGDPVAVVPMAELPGFTPPTAAGHGGQVLSLRVGDHRVLVFVGRIHAYEGHELRHVVHPVRAACAAGARTVVLTNAAGGLRDGLHGRPAGADQRPPQPDGALAAGRRAVRRPGRRVLAAAADARPRDRPVAGRGRLRRAARAALRDARRDPDAAHAGRRPGRHVDRARDDRGPRRRGARCWRCRW